MNDASITLSADLLLGHERFVRSIARGLLRDEHDVQDAVQDTWLRALQKGPRAIAALPAWLERVVRSRAVDQRRSDVARRRREQSVAVAADEGSAGAAFEHLSVQHDVVAAVLALAEPYRSVVLLRYYHGLEPAEIATRLHAKAPTVRTQLVRAHELLRERLDRDHGRAAWAALAVPFAGLRPTTSTAPAVLLGAIAAAVLGVGTFVMWNGGEAATPIAAGATVSAMGRSVDGGPSPQSSGETQVLREMAPPVPQEASRRVIPEVIGPRATLAERATPDSYHRRAFSFEHGFGGATKARKNKARNDWDVVLGGGRLRADTVTDDRSLLVDLGPVSLTALTQAPIGDLAKLVRDAAAKRPSKGKRSHDEGVEVQLGHSFFLWTNDTDSDLATLFEVVEHTPGDTCVLEWYSTEDGSWARGSLHSPRGVRTLAELATALRDVAQPDLTMREPKVTLQARTGAIGGNPCRVDVAGTASAYIRDESETPLALTPPDQRDDPKSFTRGGTVPAGMKFVITRATWWGAASGDGNGSGRLRAQIGDVELVNVAKTDGIVRGDWTGRVEIVTDEEDRVFLEVSNSSYGELVLEGTFEPLAK